MNGPAGRRFVVLLLACVAVVGCHGNLSGPGEGPLAIGRWAGGGACLSVAEATCNLVVGCGRGQFPRPVVSVAGTFNVDGTYRIEVGPISIDPAPPAHFSGTVTGSRLILNVEPAGSLPPASYSMIPTTTGTCSVPCL